MSELWWKNMWYFLPVDWNLVIRYGQFPAWQSGEIASSSSQLKVAMYITGFHEERAEYSSIYISNYIASFVGSSASGLSFIVSIFVVVNVLFHCWSPDLFLFIFHDKYPCLLSAWISRISFFSICSREYIKKSFNVANMSMTRIFFSKSSVYFYQCTVALDV